MISWSDAWQKDTPIDPKVLSVGPIDFGGAIGSVVLPTDYLEFMRESDGLTIRDEERYFIGHCSSGSEVFRYEYGWSFSDVIHLSSSFYESMFHNEAELPKGYIGIAQADGDESTVQVLICVSKSSKDYGKVYCWELCHDPWMTGGNTIGLGFVANSFTDFMNSLTTHDVATEAGAREMTERLRDPHNFASWFVASVMQEHHKHFVADLGVEACEEQTRTGLLYALHFGFTIPENQALFLTLTWDIGPNFYEEPEYAAVLANTQLSECDRAHELFEVSPQATENALKRADYMYFFPWDIPDNILGLDEDPEWPDD